MELSIYVNKLIKKLLNAKLLLFFIKGCLVSLGLKLRSNHTMPVPSCAFTFLVCWLETAISIAFKPQLSVAKVIKYGYC